MGLQAHVWVLEIPGNPLGIDAICTRRVELSAVSRTRTAPRLVLEASEAMTLSSEFAGVIARLSNLRQEVRP